MPILTCSCGAALRYVAENSGESLRCRACAAGAIVPGASAAIAAEPGQRSEAGVFPQLPPREPVWPFLVFAVLPVVLLLGGGAFLLCAHVCFPTDGKVQAANARLRVLERALKEYRLCNNGECPVNLAVLAEPDPERSGMGMYLEPEHLVDPWGNLFLYEVTPEGPLLGFKTPEGQLITNRPPRDF